MLSKSGERKSFPTARRFSEPPVLSLVEGPTALYLLSVLSPVEGPLLAVYCPLITGIDQKPILTVAKSLEGFWIDLVIDRSY
jgi:hypothetical protein